MKARFPIEGMHCSSCAINIEKDLKNAKGVKDARVNFATSSAAVTFDEHETHEHALHGVVEKAGYKVPGMEKMEHSGHGGGDHENHMVHGNAKTAARKAAFALLLAVPTLLLAMVFMDLPYSGLIQGALSTIVVLGPGSEFHVMTLKLLKRGRANMDTLISMGTLAALFFSWWQFFQGGDLYFETAALITGFILLGRYFEAKSKGRAGEAIQKLLELGAKTAHKLKDDGSTEEVEVSMLKIGDKVLVKPGEKIPLDGVVRDGQSTINESMLTGESEAVSKKIGDNAFGATMNIDGSLTLEISKDPENTVLARIVKLVREAQETKAPIEKLVDKVSGIFVPVVIIIAFVTLVVWLLLGASITDAFMNGVAVLVIACPCALGLATPTAILVGTGRGAKEGVLIKSGEALERARGITTVVFDKTGTLTEGKPAVTDIISFGTDEKTLLRLAASVEALSEHPLAQAVVERAKRDGVALGKTEGFTSSSGKGVEASVEGKRIVIGNILSLANSGVDLEAATGKIDELRKDAKTVVGVAEGIALLGLFAIADAPKAGAKEAVARLEKDGMEVIMLTGDHKATAEAMARNLGITHVIAEVLPEHKLEEVRKMKADGKRVLFVGDGINDAPALTEADLGIAVGTGSDIAIEAGQMVLVGGGPEKVVEALKLTQDTYRVIKQNLFWAFIYNVIGIPLAAFGLLNPIIASFAMAFSSVSVVLNSLRLRK